ncbi:hypothetical protein BKA70DRAFT_1241909 [Coprinopsis sp. MPI-PUGE-AT-0042]|nr:hypothetical protein BKA70DRAFT_1241909 [Coprinopsis sp. MPI-PUGE-AT-0042]
MSSTYRLLAHEVVHLSGPLSSFCSLCVSRFSATSFGSEQASVQILKRPELDDHFLNLSPRSICTLVFVVVVCTLATFLAVLVVLGTPDPSSSSCGCSKRQASPTRFEPLEFLNTTHTNTDRHHQALVLASGSRWPALVVFALPSAAQDGWVKHRAGEKGALEPRDDAGPCFLGGTGDELDMLLNEPALGPFESDMTIFLVRVAFVAASGPTDEAGGRGTPCEGNSSSRVSESYICFVYNGVPIDGLRSGELVLVHGIIAFRSGGVGDGIGRDDISSRESFAEDLTDVTYQLLVLSFSQVRIELTLLAKIPILTSSALLLETTQSRACVTITSSNPATTNESFPNVLAPVKPCRSERRAKHAGEVQASLLLSLENLESLLGPEKQAYLLFRESKLGLRCSPTKFAGGRFREICNRRIKSRRNAETYMKPSRKTSCRRWRVSSKGVRSFAIWRIEGGRINNGDHVNTNENSAHSSHVMTTVPPPHEVYHDIPLQQQERE